ncbi:MAG: hypothetical protein IKZ24_00180 [Burkholderiaceae bacterium]|nr:hypothetical protein [Burkholderiaceae bacterium]
MRYSDAFIDAEVLVEAMAYNEKDLFLILTVLCLLVLIYLIASVWRSAGKSKPQPQVKTKRIERFHRPEPKPENSALPKVPRPAPVKEAPRLPNAAVFMNEEGKIVATARATSDHLTIAMPHGAPSVPKASLKLLSQYFPMTETDGVCVCRTAQSNVVAKSMTVYDQMGNVLIQSVPLELDVSKWPTIEMIDLHQSLLEEVNGLYRREFLDRLAWRAQFFCLRMERASLDELLQVPLQSSLCRPLTLILCQRLLTTDDYWTRCRILNHLDGALQQISFENQFDGQHLNQRINSHSFAITQKKATSACIFANRSEWTLSL